MKLIVKNERDRKNLLRDHLRLQKKHSDAATKEIFTVMSKMGSRVAQAYEEAPQVNSVSISISGHIFSIEKVFKKLYQDVLNQFSSGIFNSFNKKHLEIKGTQHTFDSLANSFIRNNALKQAEFVSNTTTKEIINIIRKGQSNGLPTRDIAQRIKQATSGSISLSRANMIAVTETHNAALYAGHESSKIISNDFNLGLQKEWMSAEDGRVRPSHAITDGQKRHIDDDFDVGGQKMSRPGDGKGGANNIIRCRCILGYKNQEDIRNEEERPSVEKLDRDARNHVMAYGSLTGNEHLYVYDSLKRKRLVAHTDGVVNSVSIPRNVVALGSNKKNEIILHHNHPSSSSLSGADIELIGKFDGFKRIYAHGHNGSQYWAEKVDYSKIKAYYKSTDIIVERALDLYIQKGNRYNNGMWTIATHARNKAIADEGLMTYGHKLSKDSKRLMKKHEILYAEIYKRVSIFIGVKNGS